MNCCHKLVGCGKQLQQCCLTMFRDLRSEILIVQTTSAVFIEHSAFSVQDLTL